MPIECRPSNLCSDVRCPSCGQGFLLYGDDRNGGQRAAIRSTVQQELRRQHEENDHARDGFTIDMTLDPTDVLSC